MIFTRISLPFRQKLAQICVRNWRTYCATYPVPVSVLHILLSLAKGDNSILLKRKIRTTGRKLQNEYLAKILSNDELGTWSLDADTLNFIEAKIRQVKPTAVLEFGAGVSTICFAKYMAELHGYNGKPYVYSIEQNKQYLCNLSRRLEELKLDWAVKSIHVPVIKQKIQGIETECYALTNDNLNEFFDGVLPDFVVIDGPAGMEGVRFGTIPLVSAYLRNKAAFFLDDALRGGEIEVANRWSELSYISTRGYFLFGTGILSGFIVRSKD